jgi:hypothetical protein
LQKSGHEFFNNNVQKTVILSHQKKSWPKTGLLGVNFSVNLDVKFNVILGVICDHIPDYFFGLKLLLKSALGARERERRRKRRRGTRSMAAAEPPPPL